jgi:hypothetical protein
MYVIVNDSLTLLFHFDPIPARMDILLDIWNYKDNRLCTQREFPRSFAGIAVDFASLFLGSE